MMLEKSGRQKSMIQIEVHELPPPPPTGPMGGAPPLEPFVVSVAVGSSPGISTVTTPWAEMFSLDSARIAIEYSPTDAFPGIETLNWTVSDAFAGSR